MKPETKTLKDILEVQLEEHNKHVKEGDHYFDCDCIDLLVKEIAKRDEKCLGKIEKLPDMKTVPYQFTDANARNLKRFEIEEKLEKTRA